MAREHMKSWQVGDVTVTRVVELWDFQDNIQMTMPEATAEEVIAMDWLHPHYATPDGKQRMNFQGFVVQAPGPGDRGRFVHRRRAPARLRRVLRLARRLPRGPRKPRDQPPGRRHGDVHPPALRPCRLEHLQGPGDRRVQADFPQRPLPVRPDRVRGVAETSSATTACTPTPTSSNASTRSSRSAWPTSSRPTTRSRRRHLVRAEPRPHPRPCPRAHRLERRGSGHHRRPDAPPDAGGDAAPRRRRSTWTRKPAARPAWASSRSTPTAACW